MLANPNDFFLGRAIVEYGEYGEIEAQLLAQLFVRPGAAVEVGANIGTHTVALAKRTRELGRTLIAFEPQPFLFQNLCANLALNSLTNVRAWPWACGAKAGTVYFDVPDYESPGNFGAVAMTQDPGPASLAVPCVTLDDAIGGQAVGLLKIDVEGAELDVLRGAEAVIEKSRPVLYVENDRIALSRALIEWIWARGYRLWWHFPPLFNPENFFGNSNNLYPTVVSCNMLGLPREMTVNVVGLEEATDIDFHPLVAYAP
ncbi:FkbM family methyltransferase [Trinickia dinghuensis]|uniref:FkbM family methyltransferase n=1 Tax=Trinickia dinghuensis TaxID=2291023 RepID=A0A3D8K4U7_9BURK|nr:FkbM family methyltransferase [Trinickia dinghuensis]